MKKILTYLVLVVIFGCGTTEVRFLDLRDGDGLAAPSTTPPTTPPTNEELAASIEIIKHDLSSCFYRSLDADDRFHVINVLIQELQNEMRTNDGQFSTELLEVQDKLRKLREDLYLVIRDGHDH